MSDGIPTIEDEGARAPVEHIPTRRRRGQLPATAWIRAISTTDRSLPVRSLGTGHGRGAITVAHGAVWVANRASRTVAQVDPRTLELMAIQKFRKVPVALAAGPEAVWALGSSGWLWRIWPDGREAEGVARLGRRAVSVAFAQDLVWVLRRNGRLAALEPFGGEIVREHRVPRRAVRMVSHDGALWIASRSGRGLARVDLETGVDARVSLPRHVTCLSSEAGRLAAGCARTFSTKRGWLHLVDDRARQIVSTTELPGQPRAIASDAEAVWVACGRGRAHGGTIERVDIVTGEATTWQQTDWAVGSLAIEQGTLLASMSIASATAGGGPMSDGGFVGGGGDFSGGGGGGGGN